MAKRRKRLLKSKDPDDKVHVQQVDRTIKRGFRRNKRRLETQISDELAIANAAIECSLIKRALALDGSTEVTPAQSDPDDFTSFMKILQPPLITTPLVPVHPFEVPDSFFQTLISAILVKLKPRKSPGPDLIRTDMFKLAPALFAEAALELWRAVGRLAFIPPLLRSGLPVPIYKNRGDPGDLSNSRPINLTPAFRRLISTTLVMELRAHYREPLQNQWGFQDSINTECAVAYAVQKIRSNLPYAAVLDLRKAYDCVPRKNCNR